MNKIEQKLSRLWTEIEWKDRKADELTQYGHLANPPPPFPCPHGFWMPPLVKNFKKILVAFYEIARQWRKVNLSFIQLITRTFRKLLIENPTTSKRTPTRTQSKRDPPDEVPVNYRYRSSCICCILYLPFLFLVTLNFLVYLWIRFGNNETQPEIDEGHRRIQLK